MKRITVAAYSVALMVACGSAAYALSGPPADASSDPSRSSREGDPTQNDKDDERADERAANAIPSRFEAGGRVALSAIVGHRTLSARDGETFVLMSMTADPEAGRDTRSSAHLVLVVDRSGSMAGDRLSQAKEAARTAASQLSEGDFVSIVAFDDVAETVLAPTRIEAAGTLPNAMQTALLALGVRADTCLSCGIERGLSVARDLSTTQGADVSRLVVLSDGKANRGVVTEDALAALGVRARSEEISLTTVGLGLDYQPQLLFLLSEESNGHHHFAEDAAELAALFAQDAEELGQTIASEAEATVELAAGVELVEVVDRSFRREGNRIVVPLGAFATGQRKTVLVKVRLPDTTELTETAGVTLRYRDLSLEETAAVKGQLRVPRGIESSPLEPEVTARLSKTETAGVLRDVSELVQQGELDRAKGLLDEKLAELQQAKGADAHPTSSESLDDQIDAVDELRKDLDPAEPTAQPNRLPMRALDTMDPWSD